MEYIDEYRRITKIRRSSLRGVVRNVALDTLCVIDKVRGIEKFLNRPRIQFLYIHHIFKDEEANLKELIARLSKNHIFISYSEAVSKLWNGRIDKPYIVISSDDGFKNNLRAAEILSSYGLSACFFVNPSIVGEVNSEVVKEYCSNNLNFPPVEFLDWNEVEQLQKLGHEVGAHTMSHLNMALASKEKIVEDLSDCYSILVNRCGVAHHFAFPYGRFFNFNESCREAVFTAGFISCASAERGCHISNNQSLLKDKLCILRDHVVLNWDLDHVIHFITKNSRNASFKRNFFPYKSNENNHFD
jgi:peptidoglycan/xylan/chitin deacetylase (PgdA/CDA1 family)